MWEEAFRKAQLNKEHVVEIPHAPGPQGNLQYTKAHDLEFNKQRGYSR